MEALDFAARLLVDAQERHGVFLTEELPPDSVEMNATFDDWLGSALRPFLSETELVVAGGDLWLEFDLSDAQGRDRTPTWREWGVWVAGWANDSWQPRPAGLGSGAHARASRRWEYLDFYMRDYLGYLFADYDDWANAALRVLSRADAMRRESAFSA